MSKNVSISSLLAGDQGVDENSRIQTNPDNEIIIIPDGEHRDESGPSIPSNVQYQQPPEALAQTSASLMAPPPSRTVELSPTPAPQEGARTSDDVEVVPEGDKPKTKAKTQTKRAPAKPRGKAAGTGTSTRGKGKSAGQTRTTQAKGKAKAAPAKKKTTAKTKANSNDNQEDGKEIGTDTNANNPATNSDLRNLVSRFQTNITVGDADAPILIDDGPVPLLEPSPLPHSPTKAPNGETGYRIENTPQPIMVAPASASASPSISNLMASEKLQSSIDRRELNASIADHIKRFQTNFVTNSPSKTSISSIINIDEPEMSPVPETQLPQVDNTASQGDKSAEKVPTKKPAAKREKRKIEKKPGTAGNKRRKTPEGAYKPEKEVINLPPPELIDVSNDTKPQEEKTEMKDDEDVSMDPEKEKEKEKEREKEKAKEKEREREREREKELERIESEKKEKKELPIIALNIPLIDPNNPKAGRSEVVVNVLKLAEDKYGWSTIHPEAKSAIEVMDDLIEDNDEEENKDEENKEDEDDEEEELEDREGAGPSATNANGTTANTKKKKDENLTEEQLIRQHQTRMNRKVGKYDYEDPFIDDDELQWEEKISSTKEGFFVYWGPLIEERNTNAAKKSTKKR